LKLRVLFTVVPIFLLACAGLLQAQEFKMQSHFAAYPATPPTARAMANVDPTYLKLRAIKPGEAVSVNGFRLKKEAGLFTFKSGTFYLLEPINGVCTGAVFIGDASFSINPPTDMEQRYLSILAKDHEFVEQFNEAVFRFTDATDAEIKKAALPPETAAVGGDKAAGLLKENQQQLKTRLKENLDVRLLQDLLSSNPGGKFVAFIKGKRYGGKLIYDIDPQGVVSYFPDPPPHEAAGPRVQEFFSLAPEEVALIAWDENHFGIWTSFHLAHEYAEHTVSSNEHNGPVTIAQQKLETAFAKNAKLEGIAETTLVASRDGVKVVPLDLFATLRVAWVTGQNGEPLSFIQEGAEEDANFAVILPRELHKGESYTITTAYAGKNAVSDEGNKNYYPIARDNWYPSLGFGGYSDYEMTFHVPKGLKMVATGNLVKNTDEDKENITEWKSYAPQAVAGFNFGEYKSMEAPDLSKHYMVETDVNEMGPGAGRMPSFVPMMKKANAEGELALDLYTDYFGQEPFTRLAVTQQQATSFGQSWPGLVFLPLEYFLDATYRHMAGTGQENKFFDIVGPHEIAHQWWGHMVGFNSYRDQWMSEGFAEMSASLFLQAVYTEHGLNDFHEFWAHERKLLTDTNGEGKRAIDVGPVTLGYRLATAKTGGNIPRNLIYPKGAYILHMVRCMMQDNNTKDANGKPDVDAHFKSMMHDFTRTYSNQTATTEDFMTMVEKHMTPEMDLMRNHRMDWFFNGYVYGTEYPSYRFEQSFSQEGDGALTLNLKLTQSHVTDDFVMLVPVYVELEKGQVARLGRIPIKGNSTVEKHVRMPNMGQKPRKAMIAYLDDVLGSIENK
jgi:hypothetical protein